MCRQARMNSLGVPVYSHWPGSCVISKSQRSRIGPPTPFISRAALRISESYCPLATLFARFVSPLPSVGCHDTSTRCPDLVSARSSEKLIMLQSWNLFTTGTLRPSCVSNARTESTNERPPNGSMYAPNIAPVLGTVSAWAAVATASVDVAHSMTPTTTLVSVRARLCRGLDMGILRSSGLLRRIPARHTGSDPRCEPDRSWQGVRSSRTLATSVLQRLSE